jgi:hypothetical protein
VIKEMASDKKKFIPKSGYNVVGVDGFDVPGEQLYLVGHFEDKEIAEAALQRFQKENPGEDAYIYTSETR